MKQLSIEEKYKNLYNKAFRLEKFQDTMDTEEIQLVFYVTEQLGRYIENVIECRGSLQWIRENTMDTVEKKINLLTKNINKLSKKYNSEATKCS